MSTLHAMVPPKPKASDSGGEEAGSNSHVFGAPESWTFGDMLRIAGAVVTRNPRLVASLAGCAAVGVGLDFACGRPQIIERVVGFPVGVMAIGASYMTVVEGREDLGFSEVASRYLPRVPAAILTPLLFGLAVGGAVAVVAAVAGTLHYLDFSRLALVVGLVLGLATLAISMVYGQLLGQEVVLGGTSGVEALNRSFALTKDRLGAVILPSMGFQFLGQMVVILGIIAALVPGFFVVAAAPASTHGALALFAGTCGALFGGVIGTWIVAGFVLVYLRAQALAAGD